MVLFACFSRSASGNDVTFYQITHSKNGLKETFSASPSFLEKRSTVFGLTESEVESLLLKAAVAEDARVHSLIVGTRNRTVLPRGQPQRPFEVVSYLFVDANGTILDSGRSAVIFGDGTMVLPQKKKMTPVEIEAFRKRTGQSQP